MDKVYIFANNPTIDFEAIKPKENDIVVMMGNFYLNSNPPYKIDYYILRVARKEVGALEKRSHFECQRQKPHECRHRYSSARGFYQVKKRKCPKCGKMNKRTSVDETARICSLIDPKDAAEIPLTFGYDVLYNPTDEEVITEEFLSVIGDILLNVIDESLEHDQIQINTENRTDNSN